MKIALYNLTTTTRWGGVENFVWELAAQLAERGHSVVIFGGRSRMRQRSTEHEVPTTHYRPPTPDPRLPSKDGEPLSTQYSVLRSLYPYIDRDAWRKLPLLGRQYGLTKLLERLSMAPFALPALLKGRFDIVHIQKPYDLPIGALAKLSGARLVFGCHGKDYWPGDRLFARFSDGAVSASRYNAAQVRARYGITPRVVYNGVDLELFTPNEGGSRQPSAVSRQPSASPQPAPKLPTTDPRLLTTDYRLLPDDRPAIIYAGRMVRWKGVEYLIEALPMIRPQETVLWLAGEGEYRPTLERMAEELGVKERVRFLGKVEQPDLAALYRRSAALVAASFANETFGMALCEAMACGTPVVASNFGGFREVVQHGVTGYLTRPQDPRDIADKVNKLLANPDRAKAMGEAGRRFVEANFSWRAVADRVEEVYRAILNS